MRILYILASRLFSRSEQLNDCEDTEKYLSISLSYAIYIYIGKKEVLDLHATHSEYELVTDKKFSFCQKKQKPSHVYNRRIIIKIRI